MNNQLSKPFEEDVLDVKKQSLYARLKRLFSTDVIVRNVGGKQLKIKESYVETFNRYSKDNKLDSDVHDICINILSKKEQ